MKKFWGFIPLALLICALIGSYFLSKDSYNRGYNEALVVTQENCQQTIEQVTKETQANAYELGYQDGYKADKQPIEGSVCLHDPTYNEAKDSIGLMGSGWSVNNCLDKAIAFRAKANNKGLWCYIVLLTFKKADLGHAIIAFNTTDKGLIYIEPLVRREVSVTLGIDYEKTNSCSLGGVEDATITRIWIIK